MLFELLAYEFMIYALVLGLAIGLAAALISPFLVLNHQSMIADGLSHVAFTGIIFGLLLSNQPFYFAIPFSIAASCIITYLGQVKMIEFDSAIGVVSAFSLAIGLITVSLSDGFNRSIESLLVGNILTVSFTEVIISLCLLAAVFIFIFTLYRPLLSLTYDGLYAKISGIKHSFLKYKLSALTSVLVVVGVRTVGMLLMSAFVIFPALIAAQLAKSFKMTLLLSCVLALAAVLSGTAAAYHLGLPTGATIVIVYSTLLAAAVLQNKFRKSA